MKCPAFTQKCPENPDKDTRTDTRARIRNPDIVRPDFRPAFALSVSGLCPDEILSMAESLLAGGALTPWQRAFVVGCRKRVAGGNQGLSTRQVDVLRRLLDIASDSESAQSFSRDFRELREIARTAGAA